MSQWKVDDLATSEIMKLFYQELANGQTKSAALRAAKLAYLENCGPREAYPFLWGSFVLLGDDQPVKIKKAFDWRYVWGGVLVLFLFMII